MSREEYKDAIEVSVIFHEGQRMFAVPKQPAQQEPVAKDNSNYRFDPPGLDPSHQKPVAWWIPKAKQFCLPSSDGTRPFAKAWEPLYTSPQPAQRKPLTDEPEWIVNDLGELGVKVGSRFFFLYKGDSIEYGENCEGETVLHDDGTPMRYRIVGKREFGETCLPLSWVMRGRSESCYAVELEYTPGLSFGKPEDGEWKPLPAAHNIKENT